MKCYIDAGNTRIKWQIGPKGEPNALTWAEKSQWPTQLAASLAKGKTISAFVISSVAPQAQQQWLAQWLAANYSGVPMQWLESRARCCGVKLAYCDVAQFGVDRFCALIAARQQCPKQPVLVINAGTAITIDYLAANGQHEGGVIMPSLAAMKAGLNQLAPKLTEYWEDTDSSKTNAIDCMATSTQAALQLGARWMLISALTQTIAAMKEKTTESSPQAPMALVIAGGDAVMLQSMLDPTALAKEHLVLEGVRILSRQRQK